MYPLSFVNQRNTSDMALYLASPPRPILLRLRLASGVMLAVHAVG